MAKTPSGRNKRAQENRASANRRKVVKDAAVAGLLAASGMALGQPANAQAHKRAIRTPLTDLFGLEYPIVLAPMGAASGADLAAAVCNAGGWDSLGALMAIRHS